MKITQAQYLKALDQLPKLMKAKALVEMWEGAMESLGDKVNGMEVVSLEFANGTFTAACRPLEIGKEKHAPPEDRGAAVGA